MLLNRFFLSLSNVDWSRSRAYSRGNYGQIYVNLKGREPQGSISPGAEYDELREAIRQDLLATADPMGGGGLFDRVYMREEIYHGPYVDEAADIVFLPKDMRNKALGTLDFTSRGFSFPVHGNSGDHRMEGIFLGVGDAFKAGKRLEGLSILDIAPTVLYLLGLPVPRAMDGKVAADALSEAYLKGHSIGYTDVELLGRARGRSLGDSESEDIKRRLEGIGYVG
jgi:predicted AlkP superfamily phosphohydrolase/phosphomutase